MSDDWLMVLIEKFSAKFEQTLLYGTTVHEWIQYVLLEFMRLVFVIIATPKTIKQQFTTISVGVYHLLSFWGLPTPWKFIIKLLTAINQGVKCKYPHVTKSHPPETLHLHMIFSNYLKMGILPLNPHQKIHPIPLKIAFVHVKPT